MSIVLVSWLVRLVTSSLDVGPELPEVDGNPIPDPPPR